MNISEATLYRWKQQYGAMELDRVKELNALRDANTCLKRRGVRTSQRDGLHDAGPSGAAKEAGGEGGNGVGVFCESAAGQPTATPLVAVPAALPELSITFPDGTVLRGADPLALAALVRALGGS